MPARLAAAFGRPDVQLAIIPAAEAYEVGQPIGVRVAAVGLRDSSVLEARADLVQIIWSRNPAGGPAGPHARTITRAGSGLSLAGALPAGARAESEAVLPNWAQAPSGGRPTGARIEYQVRAELRLADGRTARCAAPVRLVSGPSLYQQVEGTQRRRRCRRCELELVAPVLRARPGGTVRGTLRITAHRPARVLSVNLHVVSQQPARSKPSEFWGGHLAGTFALGGPRDFPFEVRLRREIPPTMITPDLSVRWYLRAVVRYGLLARDSCDWELNVYTGPP